MITSEKIDKIAPAFVKAQAEFENAKKDKTNPFFKSKYADLNAYLNGSASGLIKNELSVIQDTSSKQDGNLITVTTTVLHSSGQWFKSEPLCMHSQDLKPQSFGSAQTYARRYSLSSFLNLGSEDDDGNASIGRDTKAPAPKKVKFVAPNRAKTNNALSEVKERKIFDNLQQKFEKKWSDKIWQEKTGHKNENWEELFLNHFNRVNKSPNAQTVFDSLLADRTLDGYNALCAHYDANKEIQNDKNETELLTLNNEVNDG